MRALVWGGARGVLAGVRHVEGADRRPRDRGVLVFSTHASNLDPPLLPAFLPRSDSWSMAKSEWFARPSLTSWIFSSYHAFPVIRHSPDRRALKRAIDIIRGGGVLILYPEAAQVAA